MKTLCRPTLRFQYRSDNPDRQWERPATPLQQRSYEGIWNWKRPGDDEAEFRETPRGRIWAGGPQVGPVWSEALGHLGAEQVAIGAGVLRGLPWWDLQPRPEQVELVPAPDANRRPACAIVPGRVWVVYAPTGVGRLLLKGLEPRGWRARWVDPRSGEQHSIGSAPPGEDLRWQAPPAPSEDDWVLVLEAE